MPHEAAGCRWIRAMAIAFIFLAGLGAATAEECPLDVERRVEICMAEITIAPQAGGGMALVKDVQQTQVLCQRGLLQKSADCMDKLRTRCAGSQGELARLDALFDVDSWRKGTRLMCDNSELLVENNECMKAAAPDVTKCIVLLTNSYRQQMEDIATFNSSELAKQLSCSYTGSMMNCLKRPLQKTCPDDVTELLVGVMEAFLPPACWRNRTQDLSDVTVVTRTETKTTQAREQVKDADKIASREPVMQGDNRLGQDQSGITEDLDGDGGPGVETSSNTNSATSASLSVSCLLLLVAALW